MLHRTIDLFKEPNGLNASKLVDLQATQVVSSPALPCRSRLTARRCVRSCFQFSHSPAAPSDTLHWPSGGPTYLGRYALLPNWHTWVSVVSFQMPNTSRSFLCI